MRALLKQLSGPWKVFMVVLLAGVIPSALGLTANEMFGHAARVREPLHAILGVVGSCTALIVAMLLFLRVRHETSADYLIWVVAALAVMGFQDGAHSVAPYGISWSWLRHGATLMGGLLFGLVWVRLPAMRLRYKALFVLVPAVLTLGLTAIVCWWPDLPPAPMTTDGFSSFAKTINALGGLGFLSATVFFFRRYFRHAQTEDLAFASLNLLMGTAGLLFCFSRPWEPDWWVWHFLRLLAYGLVLVAAYQMVVTLYRDIARHVEELEDRVRARTAELAADIEERKRIEETLRESEERYRTLFTTIDEGFCIIEVIFDSSDHPVDYRFVEINPAFEQQTGLSNARGKTIRELVPKHEEHWFEIYGRVARTGEPIRFQNRAEQLKRWYDVYAFRFGQPEKRLVAVLFNDVTEPRRAEEELRKSEERLWQAVRVAGLGTFEHDHRSDVIEYSPVMRKILGFGPDEPLTLPATLDRVMPEDREMLAQTIRRAHDPTGNGLFKVDYRVLDSEKRVRWVSARSQTFFEGEGSERRPVRTIGAVLDVTVHKEFQAGLERLVAERTAKLQELVWELEHFSYTITHDMRAPLRAMQGYAEIMTEACSRYEDQDLSLFLSRIKSAASRMDLLITDALNYSQTVRQDLPMEPVNLGALLRGMVDSYPDFQPSRAEIEIDGEMPPVVGNQAALTQCFSNLLGNAVKFVKPGRKPKIRVWAEQHERRVRIWVQDNGLGIPDSMLPRVFDMFSRGHPKYEGTGIGLALVRKVVQRMGGEVGVESELGNGSRFWVDLNYAGRSKG